MKKVTLEISVIVPDNFPLESTYHNDCIEAVVTGILEAGEEITKDENGLLYAALECESYDWNVTRKGVENIPE